MLRLLYRWGCDAQRGKDLSWVAQQERLVQDLDPGLTGCLSSFPAAPVVSTEGGRASSWLLTTNLLSLLFPKNFEVEADDLVTISELGRGAYGVVEKVRHAQSGTIMAVKVIRVPPCQRALGHRTPGKLPEGGVGAEDGGGLPSAAWPLTCGPLTGSGSGPP